MTIVAVTGLQREAAIAARAGVATIACAGNSAQLNEKLRKIAKIEGIISIGVAAGLAPGLKPGSCVIASEVVNGAKHFAADDTWRHRISAKLPSASVERIAGTSNILASLEAKAGLYRATGAAAADMESHIAAAFAAEQKIPFAALRIVADPAESTLPPAALNALSTDGRIRYGAVLGSIARHPGQIPALMRTAGESRIAFRELLRCVGALGPLLAAPDFGKFLLDMG